MKGLLPTLIRTARFKAASEPIITTPWSVDEGEQRPVAKHRESGCYDLDPSGCFRGEALRVRLLDLMKSPLDFKMKARVPPVVNSIHLVPEQTV
jgi:hypothetical protein